MDTIRIPAAEAKLRFSDCLARGANKGSRVIVTRRGRPIAAIVSMDDLRELEQLEKHAGLASVAGRWKGFSELAEDIETARSSGGKGRDVSL